jgi:hypothetical protein
MRKNLVVSIVGDNSVHRTWLEPAGPRNFDLCLIYYGDSPRRFACDAEIYLQRKGIKFSLIFELAKHELADVLFQYERVWMPDDDIAANMQTVNRLFLLAEEHRLCICQPAIGSGDVTFRTLRAHSGYILRYSRFVEIMCPLFTRATLQQMLPTFNANRSAWGIDWLWASRLGPKDLAVIDAVPMAHTRPLASGGVHSRFAALGVDPGREHKELEAKYGLHIRRRHRRTLRGTARIRGLRSDGTEVWTQSLWTSLWRRKAA